MPVVYGRNSMFRHMEISEQPLYEPSEKPPVPKRAARATTPVRCIETGECFRSISEAAASKGRGTSAERKGIGQAVVDGAEALGLHWEYANKRVKVLCVETRVVYESLTRAAEDMAVPGQSASVARHRISRAMKTGCTYMGFHWKKG